MLDKVDLLRVLMIYIDVVHQSFSELDSCKIVARKLPLYRLPFFMTLLVYYLLHSRIVLLHIVSLVVKEVPVDERIV